MSSTAKYVYFFVTYILTNAFFYTANNIAYSTLSALTTKDPDERVHLGMARMICATFAIMIVYGFTATFVNSLGGDIMAWKKIALIYSMIFFVTNMLCVLFTKELPEEEQGDSAAEKKKEEISLIPTLKILLTTKEFLMVLGLYMCFYLFTGVMGAIGAYYTMYILGNPGYMMPLSMAQNIPMMAAMFIVPIVMKKWGIYKTVKRSLMVCLLGTVLFLMAGISANLQLLIAAMAILCFFSGPMVGALSSTVAEIGTFIHLKKGVHIEGSLFSCSSIGIKVGSGIGSAIVGWVLSLTGFDGMAQVQSASALSGIKMMYSVVALVCFGLCFIFFSQLDMASKIAALNKERKNEG